MRIKLNLLSLCLPALFALGAVSCTDKRVEQAQHIVINELMTSNRTGLLTDRNETSDWIELKNDAKDSLNLKGFMLAVVKPDSPKDGAADAEKKKVKEKKGDADPDEEELMAEEKEEKKEKKKDKDPVKKWKFPDVTIGAGEYMVVFAEKKSKEEKESDDDKQRNVLVADFKLPKEGGTVQFLAPNGDVISEVKYGPTQADQSLSRQADGSYQPTYWQSPGQENTRKGYEAANEKIEAQRKDPLRIWELMSRADVSSQNWVELKNTGNAPVNLSAYRLGKRMGKGEGWQLPDKTLQPGEIVSIQVAGKKANPDNSLHAPFKLGKAETIVLSKNGKFVDGLCAKPTLRGGSVGRSSNRKGTHYFASPTRGEENSNGKRFIAEKPQFDKKPGVYPKEKSLTLRLKDKNQVVHYTTNGSIPTADSPVLKDSLVISKGTVVRTFAEGDSSSLRSRTQTATYILGADHQMPVMNISVNNSDLYDYNNGIYVEGPGYQEEWPHKGSNYWQRWTKDAHVEFFDTASNKDGFSVDCGLRIFGGFSRAEDKKSFRLKFRGKYGDSKVDYDFFNQGSPLELEDIVLRAGAQDWNRCMVRDEFFTSLLQAQSPAVLTQLYRPVALYINGEYFGLYYIREKIDKHFIARKLNLPTTDSITRIMSIGYNEEGPKTEYENLMSYAMNHDMSNPENYNYMRNNVDLVGLIDYKLGEIYSGNSDVGNIRYVHSGAEGSDKKWHFVFYDLDATWVGEKPGAAYYLSTNFENTTVRHHNQWINALLANKDFRALFLERLSHHLTNTFSEKNATAVFDNLVAQIRPEMKRNCQRWPKLSYEQWEKNISDFRAKFANRPKIILNDLRQYLNVTDAENKKYFAHLGY